MPKGIDKWSRWRFGASYFHSQRPKQETNEPREEPSTKSPVPPQPRPPLPTLEACPKSENTISLSVMLLLREVPRRHRRGVLLVGLELLDHAFATFVSFVSFEPSLEHTESPPRILLLHVDVAHAVVDVRLTQRRALGSLE